MSSSISLAIYNLIQSSSNVTSHGLCDHWADVVLDFLGYVLLHTVLSNSHIPWPVWPLGWCRPQFPWLCTTSYSPVQMSHPMACVTTGPISLAMYYFIQSSPIVTSHCLCDHWADVVLDFLGYVLLHTVFSNSYIPWPVWPLGWCRPQFPWQPHTVQFKNVTSHGLCDHWADFVPDFLGYVLLHTVLSNCHIPLPVWSLGRCRP
jgi:hypothetical protein